MAWQEDILTPLTITTGDKKQYTVGWMPDGRVQEYNIAEFDFNNVDGTLVPKGRPKGRKYPFKFFFQGEDYIAQVNAFLISAADSRPWTVQHPLYGAILCQVAALNLDESKLNVSEVSCTLLETITSDTTVFTVSPTDKISDDKDTNDAALLSSFDVTPSAKDITSLSESNNQLYSKGNKVGPSEEYFNAFRDANAAVLNATADPIAAMRKTQALINAPAKFSSGVKTRIGTFTSQFDALRATVAGITGRSGKKIYETQGATLISAMALASSLPNSGDYGSRNDVLSVIQPISDSYNNYVADLDTLQTTTGGAPDSYIPDPDALSGLHALINFTISQLFNIALSAKSERSILLEEDSNWILLAHRFYGISADDNEISLLMAQNNAGLSEVISVKKGRKIVWYV